MRRRHFLAAAIFAAALAYQAWALAVVEYGMPAVDAGSADVWLGEVAGPVTVAQTFRVDADGLSAVTVELRPARSSGAPAALDVVFELAEMGEDRGVRPLYRIARPAADVVVRSRYTLLFPRVDHSSGRQFRVEIGVPLAGPGEGLELRASREPRYAGGAAFLGGREQWSDLVFSASADGATALRRFEARAAGWPAIVRSRWVSGVLWLAYNVVLWLFVWMAIGDRAAPAPVSRAVGSRAAPVR